MGIAGERGLSNPPTPADAGTITLTGIGGNGTTSNHGVYLLDAGTAILTTDGNISITGNGGSDGSNWDNNGISISTNPVIASGGVGNITFTGTGRPGYGL